KMVELHVLRAINRLKLKKLKTFVMKQVFAIFCAVILMPGLNAHAWVGGPWSNNNALESGDDGIYEAVATMSNGVGMYRWAVRNNSVSTAVNAGGGAGANAAAPSNVMFGGGILGASSSNVWFYRGITYYGPCFGVVNSAMGIVSAVGNASTDGGLNQVGSSLNNVPLTGSSPGQRDNVPTTNTVVIPGTGGTPPIVVTTVTPAQPVSTQNVGYANSSFLAKIKTKAPVKRFSGTGTINFVGQVDNVQTTLSFTDTLVPSGSQITETRLSGGGESASFPERGHKRRFKVIGTQVSTQVLP
ncbi:MAG: hypothetical protein L3J39_12960, partial [Verrucomicrobiales bacterium]|nr:hypothetical protein [Verrucomicrobiales bacterium]